MEELCSEHLTPTLCRRCLGLCTAGRWPGQGQGSPVSPKLWRWNGIVKASPGAGAGRAVLEDRWNRALLGEDCKPLKAIFFFKEE